MTERRAEFQRFRKEITKVFGRDTLICARCGARSKSTHIHHITPLIEGGNDDYKNLIPLCSDCHLEWDTYSDAGVGFGEFLTTIPNYMFAILYKMQMFRFAEKQRPDMNTIYKSQFPGNSLKCNEPQKYWAELAEENEKFCAYPYSDQDEMLRLFGKHYLPANKEERTEIVANWRTEFTIK